MSLLRKILTRLHCETFKFFNVDYISLSKIKRRDDLITLGSAYGGWIVPESLFNSLSVCYCAGCGEDISFDLELIKKFNCRVYGIDPTPRAVSFVKTETQNIPNYHFIELGLWDKKDKLKFYLPKNPDHVSHSFLNIQKTENFIEVNVERLRNIICEQNHNSLTLLKLDIEGAEYKVIDTIVEDNIDIKVLCVEFDECFNPLDSRYKCRIKSSIKKLIDAGYEIACLQDKGNYTFVKNK